MPAAIFRVLLGAASGFDLLLDLFLILNEFDVRHLRSRRRRYEEEKGQDQTSKHNGDVEEIRTACRLGHLHDLIGIDMLSLHDGSMVVGISHRICDECHKQTE